jgi:hypothetical protein
MASWSWTLLNVIAWSIGLKAVTSAVLAPLLLRGPYEPAKSEPAHKARSCVGAAPRPAVVPSSAFTT